MLNILKLLDVTVLKIMIFGFVFTVTFGNGVASSSVTNPTTVSTPASVSTPSSVSVPSGVSTLGGEGNPNGSTSIGVVMIPASQEVFSPFILTVQPQTKVVWLNNDTASHIIKTTPDASSFLNPQSFSMTVAVGQQAMMTFTKPGIYDYYDSTQATWNMTDHRVAANKGVPLFPLSMEGIIWVQGHIDGLPATVENPIPPKDEYSQDFVAVMAGGTVGWRNTDGDTHMIKPVPGWSPPINPANVATTSVLGTRNLPHGETKVITFPTPGLYYYYCPPHSSINATFHRAQGIKDGSEFPIPMEGFVLVGS